MGPKVNGIEQTPSKNPIACEVPLAPQISLAIGPHKDTKIPSKQPKTSAKMISELNSNPDISGVTNMSIGMTPEKKRATCWNKILLTQG